MVSRVTNLRGTTLNFMNQKKSLIDLHQVQENNNKKAESTKCMDTIYSVRRTV